MDKIYALFKLYVEENRMLRKRSVMNGMGKFNNTNNNSNKWNPIDYTIQRKLKIVGSKVQMKELKLIPTQVFWLQLIILVPLLPVLPIILHPYYDHVHIFQVNIFLKIEILIYNLKYMSVILNRILT